MLTANHSYGETVIVFDSITPVHVPQPVAGRAREKNAPTHPAAEPTAGDSRPFGDSPRRPASR